MNKKTLTTIGQMICTLELLWNELVETQGNEEVQAKYTLGKKISKNLEEQARGKLKSSVNYENMCNEFLRTYENTPYKKLLSNVTEVSVALKTR